MFVEILIPFIFFATVFGVLYTFLITRNKERLAMIEKGADPSIFAQRRTRIGLKLGLLAMGIAIGVLMGQMIVHLTSMEKEPATFSMVFLWAGAGLVLEHFLAKKEENKGV
ncbi:MAG: hypothetical protein HRT58_15175 [Crocinitomicaceae bacterium]|nr:hypothetical protein [Flavobacteriales bacterium]NQZ37009.1 hypothetical protein [Crocinitomicaceae bacterium]PHR26680.1 MAG: hypothetical protein COA38_14430 [Fluviicola sp.]